MLLPREPTSEPTDVTAMRVWESSSTSSANGPPVAWLDHNLCPSPLRRRLSVEKKKMKKKGNDGWKSIRRTDPKELKRQRNREYNARNKDDILKRRREARDKEDASTAVVTDQQNETNTSVPMSVGAIDMDTIELQGQMVGEHCSHNVDGAWSRQLQAEQENETQTQLSMPIDPKELRRQRDRERYARNRDEILKRQRISREKRKTPNQLLNDASTVSVTPTTGEDEDDDPYGIFEPVVENTSLEG
ncbi:hypothetical protein D1007_60968 [Hordeum vulgare]|nr:hypothetical protein D1007_60968 [Hordeum vulgare]